MVTALHEQQIITVRYQVAGQKKSSLMPVPYLFNFVWYCYNMLFSIFMRMKWRMTGNLIFFERLIDWIVVIHSGCLAQWCGAFNSVVGNSWWDVAGFVTAQVGNFDVASECWRGLRWTCSTLLLVSWVKWCNLVFPDRPRQHQSHSLLHHLDRQWDCIENHSLPGTCC